MSYMDLSIIGYDLCILRTICQPLDIEKGDNKPPFPQYIVLFEGTFLTLG
jgi:hypothetical protein